jgi:hypothetical protein
MTDDTNTRALARYQDASDVEAFAERIRTTYPGGSKLTVYQATAFAQYCLITDVNPWRGEAYPFTDAKGEFHVIDGYKALVRWARRECPYSERMVPLTTADGITTDDIGYRCFILRNDSLPLLQTLIQAGVDPIQAYEMAAVSAIGVVTKSDRWSRKWNKEILPPTGWTWDEVARKRALKNTLNRSHGAPSPSEFARETWNINDRITIPADWAAVEPGMPVAEREAIAAGSARIREAHEHAQELMAAGMTAIDAADELYGDYIKQPPDFHGAPMDELTYDDLLPGDDEYIAEAIKAQPPVQKVGRDVKELLAALKPVPETPDFSGWRPNEMARFCSLAAIKLNFANERHAKNALLQIFPEAETTPPTWADAWMMLVQHQQEAGRLA